MIIIIVRLWASSAILLPLGLFDVFNRLDYGAVHKVRLARGGGIGELWQQWYGTGKMNFNA